jgi:nitroimidazol reductase NimA-like FMN-containing flavoprotein (pyridoxamine 5'-phosphate oxidase superfamily)
MAALPAPSPRTRVRRVPQRADYDPATIHAILDEALVCHVGFVADGQPFVIPTLHGRVGDQLYLHGSTASRMIKTLAAGAPVCVTVTLLDGVVLARSAFHHSMNYRSVAVIGRARMVDDPDEKLGALESFTEQLVPGRWDEVRWPNRQEAKGTTVLALPIDEASAKIRSGGPVDDEEDMDIDVWAGVVPLTLTPGTPVPAPELDDDRTVPGYVSRWSPAQRGQASGIDSAAV